MTRAAIGTVSIHNRPEGPRPYVKVRTGAGHDGNNYRPLARVVWEARFGPIPAGCAVCHRNGNRLDCRPENLFLRTQAEAIAANLAAKGPHGLAAHYAANGRRAFSSGALARGTLSIRANIARRRKLGLPFRHGKRISDAEVVAAHRKATA